MSVQPIPAVILAGGRATRMGGGDKPLCLLAGRPMLEWIIQRLSPQVSAVALNANGDAARFADHGLPILPDSLPDYPGPLAGILAGMDWAAAQGAVAVISVAGDTPFFPADLVQRLIAHSGPSGLCLAATRDEQGTVHDHPTFGLWPVALRDDLRARLVAGQRRVRSFAQAHDPGFAIWDAHPLDPFFNINEPDDLTRAEGLLRPVDGGPAIVPE